MLVVIEGLRPVGLPLDDDEELTVGGGGGRVAAELAVFIAAGVACSALCSARLKNRVIARRMRVAFQALRAYPPGERN